MNTITIDKNFRVFKLEGFYNSSVGIDSAFLDTLRETAHRPWPLPRRAWIMRMSWCHLLFAHWRVDAERLARQLPSGLELDIFDGDAWLGIVPFVMKNVGPRGIPNLPYVSEFPELNVRTYVKHQGKPGVCFFSLDAASRLAVWGARTFFHLPYMNAEMECKVQGSNIQYRSRRCHRGEEPGGFLGSYRPEGSTYQARPGGLEHWLTERYCLYSADKKGQIYRGEIHHAQWPLQKAQAEINLNTVSLPFGFDLRERPPELLHFVDKIDVVAWGLEKCSVIPNDQT